MKTPLLAALAALAIASCHYSPAPAAEITIEDKPDGTRVITLSPEAVQACKDEGGCRLLTFEAFKEIVVQATAQACGKGI